ncbi:MAG: Lrp/AsnC family transcriptional regulator [Legionellales bacterium]|jgi:Lrp/AsnC family leucine-responsive transcriptional regulator
MNLNATDIKILRLLQKDGRATNVEIAKKTHMSPAACHTRLHKILKSGIVQKIKAILNPAALGLEATVIVGVILDRSTKDSFSEFEAAIKKISIIEECYLVAGDVDYFFKIRVKNINAFNDFHAKNIINFPGVRQVRSFFVLKPIKEYGDLVI